MKPFIKQLGQGMTEYIIIVALIAIAAIAVYGFFGDTLRNQVGGMAQELAGADGSASVQAAGQQAGKASASASTEKTLGNYVE
jgi:type IV pilus assembly protein PilA